MNLRIRITKKMDCKFTIKFMLLFVCCEQIFETIGFPHFIVFLLDGLNLFLLLNLIQSSGILKTIKNRMVMIHIAIFIMGMIVSVVNGINIALIIWALRNYLRFYVFFGACITYLKMDDIENIYSFFENLFFLNIVVLFIQYAAGYRQDWLGGIFGTATGANSYCNIFVLIVCTHSIVKWFANKTDTLKFTAIIFFSLVISVITEIKILLFEIAIIIVLTVVIKAVLEKKYKVLVRGAFITILVFCAIGFGAKMIGKYYPNASNMNFMSVEGLTYILTRESGYSGFGDLNRFTAITKLNKLNVFNENTLNRILGLGLGAAEYSTGNKILQSLFYSQYNYLHYYWFSHAWMYIECGYIGVLGYALGFLSNVPYGIKIIKRCRQLGKDSTIYVVGIILSLMTILLYVYNQSLRLEVAYLLYFAFAGIFIGGNNVNERAETIS